MTDEGKSPEKLLLELARCQSELKQVRQIQQMARMGQWSYDLSSGEIRWSDQVFNLFERAPELGPPGFDENLANYHPEDAARLQLHVRQAVEEGWEIKSDYRVNLPSGRSVWHGSTIFPVKDESGKVTGLIGTVQDITGRKRIEEDHRENKLNLETFLNAIQESAILLKRDGTILLANSMVAQRLGTSRDELAGTNIYDHFSDDVSETRRQQLDSVCRSGQARHFEDQRAGRVYSSSVYPIFDRAGAIDRFAVLAVDVTERRRTEYQVKGLNRLRETLLSPRPLDEKLQRITNGLVDIFEADFARIWVIRRGDRCDDGCTHAELTEGPHVCRHRDRCLHLVASSGRYTHLDGRVHRRVPFGCYKIGRVAAGDDPKFITNEVARDIRIHDRDWARHLGLVSFAGYRVLSPSGTPAGVLALFSKRPISPDEDQLIESLAATVSQVVETDLIEQALRLTQFSVDQSADAAYWMGPDARFRYVNEASCRMLGYTREELLQMTVHDIDPNFPAEAWPAHWKELKEKGSLNIESAHKAKDGRFIPIDISTNYVSFGGDDYNCVFVRDITERKQADEEREGLIAELQQSISQVRQLSEMLPICANCKKVRDDQGYWSAIEQYISEHSATQFSHGICPDCARDLYPEFYKEE